MDGLEMELDDFELDGFDAYDEFDAFDDEDDFDDEDEWLSDVASGLASAADWGWRRYGKKYATKRWGSGTGSDRKLTGNAAVAANIFGDVLGSLSKHSASLSGYDADPFEDEFDAEQIERMEAVAEDAMAPGAGTDDATMAADEMAATAFGTARGSRAMRPILAALRAEARRVMVMARRSPRHRVYGRLAPLALRRVAVALTRLATSGRRIHPNQARGIFRSVLSRMARHRTLRQAAMRRSRAAARRYRGRISMRRRPSRSHGSGGYSRAQRGW